MLNKLEFKRMKNKRMTDKSLPKQVIAKASHEKRKVIYYNEY
jgi:hypothetical protein